MRITAVVIDLESLHLTCLADLAQVPGGAGTPVSSRVLHTRAAVLTGRAATTTALRPPTRLEIKFKETIQDQLTYCDLCFRSKNMMEWDMSYISQPPGIGVCGGLWGRVESSPGGGRGG